MIIGCTLYHETCCQDFPDKCHTCGAFVDNRKKDTLHSIYGFHSMNKKEIKNMLEIKSKNTRKLSCIDRLKSEGVSLHRKIYKLERFLSKHNKPNDTLLSQEEIDLMAAQLYHMKRYLLYIDRRLQYHGYIPKVIEL